MLTLNALDYSSIILYCLVFILIGFWFTRLKIDSDTFFSSRNQLPGWLAGISYFMTGYSANIFTAGVAAYVMVGFAPLYSAVTLTIAGAIFAYFFAAAWWHRSGVDTVPEYLEKLYGAKGKNFIMATNLPTLLLADSIRFYINGLLISTVTGIPLSVSLTVTTAVLLAYVVTGGLWGAVITDTIQCFLLFLLLLLMVILSLVKVGGIGPLLHGLPAGHFNAFPGGGFSLFQGMSAAESWCVSAFIFGILISGPMSDSTIWACVQRYTSSKNIRETRKVPLYYVGLTVPMLILIALPAMAGKILVPEAGESWKSAEMVYINTARLLLPHGLLALLIIGILSANMSTLSSNSVIYSQIISNDIYKSFLRPHANARHMLWIGRLITLLCMLFCTLMAFLVPKVGGIFWSNMMLGAMMAPAMGVPVFISLFYKKTPGWGLIASCVAGMLTGTFLNFSKTLGITEMEIAFWIRGSVPFAVVALGMIATGVLFPPRGKAKEDKEAMADYMGGRRKTERQTQDDAEAAATKGGVKLPPFFMPVNSMIGIPLILFGLFTGVVVQFSTDRFTISHISGMVMCLVLAASGIALIINNNRKKAEYFKATGHL